jgi:DnaJ-class molecular chaperone
MLRNSYYVMLGVSDTETTEGIQEAFREIINRYRPDRLGAERSIFLQRVLHAYRTLRDPARRREYDERLRTEVPDVFRRGFSGAAERSHASAQAVPLLRTILIGRFPFEAPLARVSGRLTAAQLFGRFQSVNAVVVLSAAEASSGGLINLVIPGCSPCTQCGGSGREGLFPCASCDGEGLFEVKETVPLRLPPMMGDGSVLDVPLRGWGLHDLYLRVQFRVERSTTDAAQQRTGGSLWPRQ